MDELSIPPEELSASFAGRPDLEPLWQLVLSGETTFTPAQRILLLLAESRAHEKAGRFPQALARAREALKLAQETGDSAGIAGGLTHLANVHMRMGQPAEASRLAEESLSYEGEHFETVTALLLLGLCADETSDWPLAEHYYHRAAHLSRQLGYPTGRALALPNLSIIYFQRGAFNLASTTAAESHRILIEIGYPSWFYPLLKTWLHQFAGERHEARAELDQFESTLPAESWLRLML
jgi:tetratricopeptide (TPR) repeat protein